MAMKKLNRCPRNCLDLRRQSQVVFMNEYTILHLMLESKNYVKNKIFVIKGGACLLGTEFVRNVTNNEGIPINAEIHIEAGENVQNKINIL